MKISTGKKLPQLKSLEYAKRVSQVRNLEIFYALSLSLIVLSQSCAAGNLMTKFYLITKTTTKLSHKLYLLAPKPIVCLEGELHLHETLDGAFGLNTIPHS